VRQSFIESGFFYQYIVYENSKFFDINTLITINSKVWIIDKLKPNIPIVKISKSEFNLLNNGVYKKDGIRFTISGKAYWVNKELIEKLKLGVKIKISIYQIYHSLCKSL
jgi:hypothetical protein